MFAAVAGGELGTGGEETVVGDTRRLSPGKTVGVQGIESLKPFLEVVVKVIRHVAQLLLQLDLLRMGTHGFSSVSES